LLIKRTKSGSVYWVMPGGGVERNETDEQTLIRECQEELGIDIEIRRLLLEIESQKPKVKGQKERFYLCKIIGGVLGAGQGPEYQPDSNYMGSYELEWRSIKDLSKIDLKPNEISEFLKSASNLF